MSCAEVLARVYSVVVSEFQSLMSCAEVLARVYFVVVSEFQSTVRCYAYVCVVGVGNFHRQPRA